MIRQMIRPVGQLVCSLGLLGVLSLYAAPAIAEVSGNVHHQVDVKIDPQNGSVIIDDLITLTASDTVTFQLSPAFILDEVTLGGKPRTATRTDQGFTITLGDRSKHRVRVQAHAKLARGAPPYDVAFLGQDGGFLGTDWLAHPAGVAATWSATVVMAPDQRVIIGGKLVSEETSADGTLATFASERPGDTPVLITGPFEVSERISDGVRLRTYFHRELASRSQAYLDDAASHIKRFSKTIGAYPYESFSVISGPVPIGVAFPAMTYMGRSVLAMAFIRTASLPHEILHSWWGSAVEVDYAQGNWAEGLTNYMTTHDLNPVGESETQTRQRLKAEKETRQQWLRNYAALPNTKDMALSEFRSRTHDSTQVIGYAKAAFVFHMLRKEVGDDVFVQAIQHFYQNKAFKRAGWEEISAAIRKIAGHDLGAFFHQWVERRGAPKLKARITQAPEGRLQFTLRQSQKGRGYRLRLGVEIETEQGIHRDALMMAGSGQTLSIKAPAKVLAVTIDPDTDLFRKLGQNEAPAILRDITLASGVTIIDLNDDASWTTALDQLGATLLDGQLERVAGKDLRDLPDGALIIAGNPDQMAAFVDRHRLSPRPKEVAQTGSAPKVSAKVTARVWTLRDQKRAILYIEGESAAAVLAIARPLTHYKRRSWVSFDGRTVTNKGTWAMQPGTLHKRFDLR